MPHALSMFVAICNEHWVLISFGDIRLSAYPCSCGYTLTIPHPIPSPTTLGPNIPRVFFPSSRPLGWDSLPRSAAAKLMIVTRQRQLCLSLCSSLHAHGPPRSHTWTRTLTTPLYAATLHSHLLPTHTVAPHKHLYFGYQNACPARTAGPSLSVR